MVASRDRSTSRTATRAPSLPSVPLARRVAERASAPPSAVASASPEQMVAFDVQPTELLAEDVLDRSGPTPSRGVEPFKARAAAVRAAFAEIEIRVEDSLVDGDAIAWRWALTGTHVGTFAGVAP